MERIGRKQLRENVCKLDERLLCVESYIDAARTTVHFTVDEVQELLARIEKLEAAAAKPAPQTKTEKAEKAKEPK